MTSRSPRRVVGRPAIVRSLHGLHLRVCRFAQHRATTELDQRWAARTLDAIADALVVARDVGRLSCTPDGCPDSVPTCNAEVTER